MENVKKKSFKMENVKKKSYKCEICNSDFTTKGSLNSHISSVHEEKKLFT